MTNGYYTTPEDIKMSWAHLVDDLVRHAADHGGEEMTFAFVVRNRIPGDILEPVFRKREPRSASPHANAQPWWSVIRRLQSCAGETDRLIEISIDLDLHSNPVSWREPSFRQMDKKR